MRIATTQIWVHDQEYPATLLQEHPDALITATADTARHPVAEHPEWRFDHEARA